MACNESGPTAPVDPAISQISMLETGIIAVHVHWQEQGEAGKRVEVLETGQVKMTDRNGNAFFRVPAGTYTVRVYEINRGGPAFPYVDTKVTVSAYQRVTVDIVDCLPCV
jgi:hypothetical protein